jgi:hypothetical protein
MSRLRAPVLACGCWILGLALSGCPMSKDPTSPWIGHHRDELVQTWGNPTHETRLPDGGTVILYSHNWHNGYGIHTCKREFVTDGHGLIRSTSSSDCS